MIRRVVDNIIVMFVSVLATVVNFDIDDDLWYDDDETDENN
jgi:hypothetical protein